MGGEDTTLEDRLAELEAKVTFQERALAEMSLALYESQRRVDGFEALCRRLSDQVRRLSGAVDLDSDEEAPPPHY